MEFHMINITYAALHMRAETEKTTFSCKDDCTLTEHTRRWTYSALRYFFSMAYPRPKAMLGSFYVILNHDLCNLLILIWQISVRGKNYDNNKQIAKHFLGNIDIWDWAETNSVEAWVGLVYLGFFHRVKFYFWLWRLITFLGWAQLCCVCKGEES